MTSRPHAIITGASSGIGEQLARHFVEAGYNVSILARRLDALESLAAALGTEHALPQKLDVCDDAQCDAVLQQAVEHFGPPAVVVNNAGMLTLAHTDDVAFAEVERIIDINLRAPLRIQTWALQQMAEAGGSIVNVTSAAAYMWAPFYAYYNATKAGLAAASESLAAEHRRIRHPVHVMTVYPGPVRTAMSKAASDELGLGKFEIWPLIGTTDVLCRRILAGIRRRRTRLIYPRVFVAPYFWARLINWLAARLGPVPPRRLKD